MIYVLQTAISAPVAQLDRAPGFEPGGSGFESLRVRQYSSRDLLDFSSNPQENLGYPLVKTNSRESHTPHLPGSPKLLICLDRTT